MGRCRTARRTGRSCIRSSSIRATRGTSTSRCRAAACTSRSTAASFAPLVDGMETVEGFDPADVTFHDPHCMRLCPGNPDRLYQQNHCGIYRLDRPGHAGCASAQHAGGGRRRRLPAGRASARRPTRPGCSRWTVPTSGRAPARAGARRSTRRATAARAGSATTGLPASRRGGRSSGRRCAPTARPVGLYFGTTSGELWLSRDEGGQWENLARHLPEIYAIETAYPD
jgi:hypothetical protein